MWRWRRARGLWTVAGKLFASVCMLLAWWPGQWTSDHRTFAETPWCAALVSGLFVAGPGGRNYTRDDPVLLGLPAFQVGLSFVGWLWSYSPRSLATSELIPLMSPYTDHQIATIPSLSLHKPARTVCQGHAAQRVKLNHYFVHEVKLWLLLQCNYTQDMLTGSNSSVIKNIWS